MFEIYLIGVFWFYVFMSLFTPIFIFWVEMTNRKSYWEDENGKYFNMLRLVIILFTSLFWPLFWIYLAFCFYIDVMHDKFDDVIEKV